MADEEPIVRVEKVTGLVQIRLMLRILENLLEEQHEELEQVLEVGDQEAIETFFNRSVPQFAEWMAEEMARSAARVRDS